MGTVISECCSTAKRTGVQAAVFAVVFRRWCMHRCGGVSSSRPSRLLSCVAVLFTLHWFGALPCVRMIAFTYFHAFYFGPCFFVDFAVNFMLPSGLSLWLWALLFWTGIALPHEPWAVTKGSTFTLVFYHWRFCRFSRGVLSQPLRCLPHHARSSQYYQTFRNVPWFFEGIACAFGFYQGQFSGALIYWCRFAFALSGCAVARLR